MKKLLLLLASTTALVAMDSKQNQEPLQVCITAPNLMKPGKILRARIPILPGDRTIQLPDGEDAGEIAKTCCESLIYSFDKKECSKIKKGEPKDLQNFMDYYTEGIGFSVGLDLLSCFKKKFTSNIKNSVNDEQTLYLNSPICFKFRQYVTSLNRSFDFTVPFTASRQLNFAYPVTQYEFKEIAFGIHNIFNKYINDVYEPIDLDNIAATAEKLEPSKEKQLEPFLSAAKVYKEIKDKKK
ncbi:MAG: hypothetical protein ACOYT8_03835 [Candidatus Dependentiae bacterium]